MIDHRILLAYAEAEKYCRRVQGFQRESQEGKRFQVLDMNKRPFVELWNSPQGTVKETESIMKAIHDGIKIQAVLDSQKEIADVVD